MANWRERWPEFAAWLDREIASDTRVEDPDGENPYEEEA